MASSAKSAVPYAVIDAFTGEPFKGNPAAVCLLMEDCRDVDEQWMLAVAREFNISETCFLSPAASADANFDVPRYYLRWFTPVTEVKLCGHATLAAAHFLFTSSLLKKEVIEFDTKSGVLTAKKIVKPKDTRTQGSTVDSVDHSFYIQLSFPVEHCDSSELPSISETLDGTSVVSVHRTAVNGDFIVELSSSEEVLGLHPNFIELGKCEGRGVIFTGPAPTGSGYDFFTRFFCPKFGINEDPVCGSAHCSLAPFWSKKTGKQELTAYMASPRGGVLHLKLEEQTERVLISGEAVTVMVGSLLA